jgi:hypothetical protein
VRNENWPFRRSDLLFVVAVVLFALPDPGTDWSFGIPSTATKLGLVAVVVLAWIRFYVFGSSDRETR